MNDLEAELRFRREQRLVSQEMAMDAIKPYIGKTGRDWELIDATGKVFKRASSMEQLKDDLDKLLAARGAKDAQPAMDATTRWKVTWQPMGVNGPSGSPKTAEVTASSRQDAILKFPAHLQRGTGSFTDVIAMDEPSTAMDHGYVVERVGQYQIIEGAGVDGGSWFAKGRGENKRFKTRAQAVSHAQSSDTPGKDSAITAASSGVPNMGRVLGKDERRKFRVVTSDGDSEIVYADSAEAAKARVTQADPKIKIKSVTEVKGRTPQGEDSASTDKRVLGKDAEENKLVAKAGTPVTADLPSGFKQAKLEDNLYSGMYTVRVRLPDGSVHLLPVKRVKL